MRTFSMKWLWTLVFALPTAAIAAGEPPRTVIAGPQHAPLGELVILDASQSVGQAYHWVLLNSSKTFLPIEEGKRLVFASGQAGEFVFLLAVGGYNEQQQLAVQLAEHRLRIGPAQPDPAPTTFGVFSQELPVWAAEVVTHDRRGQARLLAAAFRSFAERAQEYESLAEFTRATSADYRLRLGLDAHLAWRPALERIEKELHRLQAQEQLAGPSDFAAAWRAIATGLERVE